MLLAGNSAPPAPDGSPGASLTISVTGLRSARGVVQGCLTRSAAHFPNCDKDPAAIKVTVAAQPGAHLHFTALPSGDYALSILHDENGNGRVDTMLGIPREGVGFSENPVLRFGPPSFKSAAFHIGTSDLSKDVRIKYFL